MAARKKKQPPIALDPFEEGKKLGLRIGKDLDRLFRKFPLPTTEVIRGTIQVGNLEVTVTRHPVPVGRVNIGRMH